MSRLLHLWVWPGRACALYANHTGHVLVNLGARASLVCVRRAIVEQLLSGVDAKRVARVINVWRVNSVKNRALAFFILSGRSV